MGARMWAGLAGILLVTACATPAAGGPDARAQALNERLKSRDIDPGLPCAEIDALQASLTGRISLAQLSEVRNACALPTDGITLADADAALGSELVAMDVDGDTLTLFQRAPDGPPDPCCSIQDADWRELGDGQTYVARFRLRDLQSGMLAQMNLAPGIAAEESEIAYWRGPSAPPEPVIKPDLVGVLSEHTLYSPELRETRRLLVYVPQHAFDGPPAMPAIFLADGGNLHVYARMLEPLIDAGAVRPVIVVGLIDGQDGIVEDRSDLGPDIRSLDYLPIDFPESPPSRFDAHLAFVADRVAPWLTATFGASADPALRAVTGSSNGGGFALNAGFRRPDVFGHAWPMSVGAGEIETADPPPEPAARFRLSAGYYEPGFIAPTRASAAVLQQAGYAVHTQWYAAGHMGDQWEVQFLENLKAVFPGPNATAE